MTQSARNMVAVKILLALGVVVGVGVVLYQLSYSDDRPVIIVSEGSVDIKASKDQHGQTGQFDPTTDDKHWVHKYAPDPANIGSLTLKIMGATSANGGCAINGTAKVTGSIVLSYNLNGTAGTLTIFLSNGEVYLVSDAVDMRPGSTSAELVIAGDGPSGGSALTQVTFSLDNGNGGSNTFACTPSSSKSLKVHIKQRKK